MRRTWPTLLAASRRARAARCWMRTAAAALRACGSARPGRSSATWTTRRARTRTGHALCCFHRHAAQRSTVSSLQHGHARMGSAEVLRFVSAYCCATLLRTLTHHCADVCPPPPPPPPPRGETFGVERLYLHCPLDALLVPHVTARIVRAVSEGPNHDGGRACQLRR